MPIEWGVPAAKVFAGVWLVVLSGAIALLVFYMLFNKGWLATALYCFFILILPLLWLLKKLYRAQATSDYHAISSKIKLLMLAGIFSILLLKLYL